MKALFLSLGLLVFGLSLPAPAQNAAPLEVKTVKTPVGIAKQLKNTRILRALAGPFGSKREIWFGLFTQGQRAGEGVAFSVWAPRTLRGKTMFSRVGIWRFGVPGEVAKDVEFSWLNHKTGRGWVLSWWSEGASYLVAFPQGPKTNPKNLVSDSFEGSATSIYATSWTVGTLADPSGFYSVTKTYSEPGQDENLNTITVETLTHYFWNGSGWSKAPDKFQPKD